MPGDLIQNVMDVLAEHVIPARPLHQSEDRWRPVCSCGWQCLPGYTLIGTEKEGRRHIALALAGAGLLPTETEWGVQWNGDIQLVPDEDTARNAYGPHWTTKTRSATPWKDPS